MKKINVVISFIIAFIFLPYATSAPKKKDKLCLQPLELIETLSPILEEAKKSDDSGIIRSETVKFYNHLTQASKVYSNWRDHFLDIGEADDRITSLSNSALHRLLGRMFGTEYGERVKFITLLTNDYSDTDKLFVTQILQEVFTLSGNPNVPIESLTMPISLKHQVAKSLRLIEQYFKDEIDTFMEEEWRIYLIRCEEDQHVNTLFVRRLNDENGKRFRISVFDSLNTFLFETSQDKSAPSLLSNLEIMALTLAFKQLDCTDVRVHFLPHGTQADQTTCLQFSINAVETLLQEPVVKGSCYKITPIDNVVFSLWHQNFHKYLDPNFCKARLLMSAAPQKSDALLEKEEIHDALLDKEEIHNEGFYFLTTTAIPVSFTLILQGATFKWPKFYKFGEVPNKMHCYDQRGPRAQKNKALYGFQGGKITSVLPTILAVHTG